MTYDSVVDCLFDAWRGAVERGEVPQSVLLLGPPGIGKTSAASALAARMQAHARAQGDARPALLEVRDLSSCLPEDLGGLPFRDGSVTRYAPQEWMARLADPDAYGVLVLDDLPAATAAVQVASRQIALDHRANGLSLSSRVMVVVTGNRREDRSAASALPAHFRNSVLMLPVLPCLDGWLRWYAAQGLDPIVARYLISRPAHFSTLPKDADALGAFATPRSWAMLARLLPMARANGRVREIAAGLVGEGIAGELAAFLDAHEGMVSPEAVLDDPQGALPDPEQALATPDRRLAMAHALAEHTARRAKGARATAHLLRYLEALAWVTERAGREYVATSVSAFERAGGSIEELRRAMGGRGVSARVHTMVGALTASLQAA
jgi:hypothetical protein